MEDPSQPNNNELQTIEIDSSFIKNKGKAYYPLPKFDSLKLRAANELSKQKKPHYDTSFTENEIESLEKPMISIINCCKQENSYPQNIDQAHVSLRAQEKAFLGMVSTPFLVVLILAIIGDVSVITRFDWLVWLAIVAQSYMAFFIWRTQLLNHPTSQLKAFFKEHKKEHSHYKEKVGYYKKYRVLFVTLFFFYAYKMLLMLFSYIAMVQQKRKDRSCFDSCSLFNVLAFLAFLSCAYIGIAIWVGVVIIRNRRLFDYIINAKLSV